MSTQLLRQIHECFLGLSIDPTANILKLTDLCAELGCSRVTYCRQVGNELSIEAEWLALPHASRGLTPAWPPNLHRHREGRIVLGMISSAIALEERYRRLAEVASHHRVDQVGFARDIQLKQRSDPDLIDDHTESYFP